MSRFAWVGKTEVALVAQQTCVAQGTGTGGFATVGTAGATVLTGIRGAHSRVLDLAVGSRVAVSALALVLGKCDLVMSS